MHARAGLPNFLTKANTAGAEIKIGYFGGSITAQAGWRPKTLAYFQKTYPQAKFSEINAAIGGTGSDLGVFRVKQDVLDKKPDLMFVEFAVNDGGASPEQIFRCMEGIVRQTWRALPECDICFVYTLTEAPSPAMLEGKFQRSASAMEKIADHYGIPTIHMGMEVAKLAKEGKLAVEGAAAEDRRGEESARRTNSSSRRTACIRMRRPAMSFTCRPSCARWSRSRRRRNARPARAEAPFIATNYEQAKLLPLTKDAVRRCPLASPCWIRRTDEFGKRWAERMTTLHKAAQPGETITFKFKGTRCASTTSSDRTAARSSSRLMISPQRLSRDLMPTAPTTGCATMIIGSDLEDEVHTVKIEIHPEPGQGEDPLQRKDKMDKPERFDGTAFYPGAILAGRGDGEVK